ncbi:flagellar hook-length control protein FliK [Moorellaceae bacterium AZ2]
MSPYPIGKLQLQAKAQEKVPKQGKDSDAPPFSACLAGLLPPQGTPVQEGPRPGGSKDPAVPGEMEGIAGSGLIELVVDTCSTPWSWSAAGEGTNQGAREAVVAALTGRAGEAQIADWSGGHKPVVTLEPVTLERPVTASTPELPPAGAGGRNPAEPVQAVRVLGQGGGAAQPGALPPGLSAAGEEVAAVFPQVVGDPQGHEQADGGARTYQVPETNKALAAAGGTRGPGPSPATGTGSVPVRPDSVWHPSGDGATVEDGVTVRDSVMSAKAGEKPAMGAGREPAVNPRAYEGVHVGGSVSPTGSGTAAGSAAPVGEKPAVPSGPAGVPTAELAARIISLTRGSRTERQELELQLKPPGLGKMRLYTVLVDNRLSVHMVVETLEAGRLLQVSLPELRQALQGQGLSLDQVQVQVNGGYSGDREGPAGRDGWSGPGGRGWQYAVVEQEDLSPPSWDTPYRLDYLA